jgi:hypothetical protein
MLQVGATGIEEEEIVVLTFKCTAFLRATQQPEVVNKEETFISYSSCLSFQFSVDF